MAIDAEKFEVSKTEGIATVKYNDENAFYEGTELSKKVIKEVFDHAHSYIEEATKTAAEQSTKIMSKDKDIDKVVVEYPYGVSKRGQLNVVAKRSQTFTSPADGTEITKSTLSVTVKDPLTKVSKSKIQDLTKEMTATLLT